MDAIIDLDTELLIDRSRIRNPYLRLLLTAMGEELAEGSPWVAVNKGTDKRSGRTDSRPLSGARRLRPFLD